MEVTSLCELPVASLLWQPRPGAWMLTFVCKATFELHPGESPLAHAQEPVYESDQHWSNDPAWSLYAPRDIVPIRPRADVVLVGHAFAPNETPMRSLVARLVVADIEKAIEVWCDRWWSPDGTLNEGPRFVRMPMVYERAAAGPDAVNPVGLREGSRDRQGKRDLPNLQPVGAAVKSPSDPIEPVGFGPIAASWGVRQRKLGRHAGTWDEKAFHQAPLPHDIDASYFNVAPRDQQTTELKSGARLVLDNLHPEHWHLVTSLAAISPHALVERPGQGEQNVAMRPDLLWIHTDRGICTLTFRGQIPIEHPLEKGTVKIALEDGGAAAGWEEIEPEAEETTPGSEGTRVTVVPESPVSTLGVAMRGLADAAVATASGLPFAPIASPAAPPTRPSPAESRLAHTPFAATAMPATSAPDSWKSSPASGPISAGPGAPPISAGAPASRNSPVPMPILAPPAIAAPPSIAIAPPPTTAPPSIAIAPPPIAAPPSIASIASIAAAGPIAAAIAPIAAPPRTTPPSSAPPSIESPWISNTARGSSPSPVPAPKGSAVAASNAAADASASWLMPRAEAYRPAAPKPFPIAHQSELREIIQLIWLDPDSVPRVRRQPAWKRILNALEDEPPDAELDDAGASQQPVEIEDRREVFEILARGEAIDESGIQEALAAGARDSGKFASPIKLLVGELSFPFDELETLKATVATVTPLMGNDEGLKTAVTNAQDLLKLPDLRTAPPVVEGLTTRIREAFGQGKRAVPQAYLDTQVERVLLEQRHYQRRAVFGKPHLRALLTPPGSSQQIPTYMPDDLAQKLPLFQRFRARLITEIHPQVDQYETHPTALRVIALARAMPPPIPPMR